MASTQNIKKAIMVVMEARVRGIVWKLILQIIHDCPSAICNAWQKIDKSTEPCPAKLMFCCRCGKIGYFAARCPRCPKEESSE